MGLDMYLYKKRYTGRAKATLTDLPAWLNFTKSDFDKVCSIEMEAAYWRKANHIHKWFVDNVQGGVDDCGTYPVSAEQLQTLIDRCKEVLADHKLASKLLPTQSGFFFGGTDYDDYYYDSLKDTIKMLENALEECKDYDYSYSSSW